MTPRRSSLKVTPGLESLDARIVPAVAHFTHAQLVAIRAQLRAAHHHVVSTQAPAQTPAHVQAQAVRAAVRVVPTNVATTSPAVSPVAASVRDQAPAAAPSVVVAPSSTPAIVSGAFSNTTASPNVTNQAAITTTPRADATTTPTTPPNVDNTLAALSNAFALSGAGGVSSLPLANMVTIQGSNVQVNAHWKSSAGDFNQYVSALTALGMNVQATDAQHGLVVGMLPMNQIVAAANLPQTASLTAGYRPFKD